MKYVEKTTIVVFSSSKRCTKKSHDILAFFNHKFQEKNSPCKFTYNVGTNWGVYKNISVLESPQCVALRHFA